MKALFISIITLFSSPSFSQMNFLHGMLGSGNYKLNISCVNESAQAVTLDPLNPIIGENYQCVFSTSRSQRAINSISLSSPWQDSATGNNFIVNSVLSNQAITTKFGICGYNFGNFSSKINFTDIYGKISSQNVTIKCPVNNWGSGELGDITLSSNTNLCTDDSSSVTCVRQYRNLIINSGATVSTAVPKKGLIIYVNGNATINGTISMTARGVGGDPGGPMYFVRKKTGGTVTSGGSSVGVTGSTTLINLENKQQALSASASGIQYYFNQSGPGGGVSSSAGQTATRAGNSGNPGYVNSTTLVSGGGGSGGAAGCSGNCSGISGAGSYGSPFSGGSGGGGSCTNEGSASNAQSGTGYGGKGGNGGVNNFADQFSGGGAGNPGGAPGRTAASGNTGTGGLIIMFVKGTLTVNGSIVSRGSNGGNATSGGGAWSNTGGGGSGGGIVLLITGSPTSVTGSKIDVQGGLGGEGKNKTYSAPGGPGGAGGYLIDQVIQ